MTPIKIAVISDLHIGEGVYAKDLCPYSDSAKKINSSDFIGTFASFISREKIEVDYLIVAGDISEKSRTDEVVKASEVLNNFMGILNVAKEKTFFTVGNHDNSWDDPDSRPSYSAFTDSNNIFKEIDNNSSHSLFKTPFYTYWENDEIIVFSYNSAHQDHQGTTPHKGCIPQAAIKGLDNLFEEKAASSKYKIFVVHHHLLQYSNPIPDEPDFSIMVNAQNLIDLLTKHNFDLVIHGHKHCPKMRLASTEYHYSLPTISAGSFSKILDTRWNGYVNNQFHVIEIHGKERTSTYGVMKSWALLAGDGWIPSNSHHGIHHEVPFKPFDYLETKNKIINAITLTLEHKTTVTWKEVVEIQKDLIYLRRELLEKVLNDIDRERKFIVHPSPKDSPETIIFILREEK